LPSPSTSPHRILRFLPRCAPRTHAPPPLALAPPAASIALQTLNLTSPPNAASPPSCVTPPLVALLAGFLCTASDLHRELPPPELRRAVYRDGFRRISIRSKAIPRRPYYRHSIHPGSDPPLSLPRKP
uniref:Uncharacterized protein n=1 Tax=Oryza glumipatula TaxID=40148 RepID=A0A0E0B1Z4_9ORYZ